MGASLSILVGLPLMAGKLLLSIDVLHTILTLGVIVLRGLREITDPVVDILWEITREVVLVPGLASFRALERIVARKLGLELPEISFHSGSVSSPSSVLLPTAAMAWLIKLPSIGALLDRLPSAATSHSLLLDALEYLGHAAYILHSRSREISIAIASSDKMSDRAWCLLAGYALGFAIITIVAIAGEEALGRLGGAVADGMRRYGLCFKVSTEVVLSSLEAWEQ
jgi:E3 ubiquitin-protein ligase MARCH6